MPYSAGHKKRSRRRILNCAAQRFLREGFDGVGIDEIMADAGMTRGAFYAHFKSKKDLYSKAMTHAATHGRLVEYSKSSAQGAARIDQLLAGYLSREHHQGPDIPCPMAFLVTDVANREPEVRKTYTRIFKRFGKLLTSHADDSAIDEKLLAVSALMIGGVALARVLDDEELSDKLLVGCRKAAAHLVTLEHY